MRHGKKAFRNPPQDVKEKVVLDMLCNCHGSKQKPVLCNEGGLNLSMIDNLFPLTNMETKSFSCSEGTRWKESLIRSCPY